MLYRSVPYFSVVGTVFATMTTMMLGYYMVYKGNQNLGLCFMERYPAICQACLLDMTSGALGTLVGFVFMFMECVPTPIKQRDWKTVFCTIKICSTAIVSAMLVAGTIQGIVAVADTCDDRIYYYDSKVEYLFYLKNCYLSSAQHTDDDEADFAAIVTLSSVATLWWIILLFVEIIRTCLVHPERPVDVKCTSNMNV